MKKVGFIGAGVMGASMIRSLIKNGFEVVFYSRNRQKTAATEADGAVWVSTAAEAARGRDAVITIVGMPSDVEEVYFGETGILENADPGTLVIDMTTSSPKLAQKIYEAAAARGLSALDAPVSGGDTGARAGTLSIMVGGDPESFEAALPLFKAMGTNIIHEGPAGAGQHTKMANQIAIAGCIAGVAEAIAYSEKAGLDTQKMFDSISAGAAGSWQLTNNGAHMLKDEFDPGFYIKHFIKDMRIAVEEADSRHLDLKITRDVLNMYVKLLDEGQGDLGTQAIIKYYRQQ
ncbi:MAG: NAD(P)-dependent oxidoreductase [Lachnospiraceae bacterium]|jgi:3-hydroxyisobutyrate dehydrogenase